ncbi:MAG TPA: hypothetical protein PKZ01_00675 [Candidatus Hydrogenedentes bacterium]|nr:hypothetical protein [Candidatus Hydrogenedentota bacterium]
MPYEYLGLLKTLLPSPPAEPPEGAESVEFGPDDLMRWTVEDLDSNIEWKHIPASHSRTDEGVRLVGRFEDVRRMDCLEPDDPRFWVPLGTCGVKDDRFPVDALRFPVMEVTYRCLSENAFPAIAWNYRGGEHIHRLSSSRRWRTAACCISHNGFPERLESVIIRLFSTSRSSESMEMRSIRFRTMSSSEAEAFRLFQTQAARFTPPPPYQSLNDFMPLGTVMNAQTARRMAETLGIGADEYWSLALEDLVRHHHNCVMLEDGQTMTANEWEELIALFERFKMKLLPMVDFPVEEEPAAWQEYIANHIKPYAQSDAILAWSLNHAPERHALPRLTDARALIEQADPLHPLAVITRQPGAYVSLAPYFAASGIARFVSHASWHVGELVREHSRLCQGQQFWLMAPAFIHASGAPDWNSCAEMRLMANLALANGARGWFTYAYHNDPVWMSGDCQRSLTGPFLAFSDLWLELDQRMDRLRTLAPLFLNASAEEISGNWYISSVQSGDHTYLPGGAAPIGSFRFLGPDYELYVIINNDIRGMASLNIDFPPESLDGQELYDVSDFISERQWVPMNLNRHLEMFPGQARAILKATPEVCAFWRNNLASALIEDDRQIIAYDYKIAQTYGLNTAEIEENLEQGEASGGLLNSLAYMDRARAQLVDLIYDAPAISIARSRVIEASAALCACDGALCRVMARGKVEKARELGQRLTPLAREFIHMRLELRLGHGSAIVQHAESVVRRTLELLAEIRSHA